MRVHHLAAAVVLALSSALLTASCVQESPTVVRDSNPGDAPPSDIPEPIGEAHEAMGTWFLSYKPDAFPYVVVKDWDGKDDGGGRQLAYKDFVFDIYQWLHVLYSFHCPVEFEMAVQSRTEGHIGTDRAARVTAKVATQAANAVAHSRDDWDRLGVVFCTEFKKRMRDISGDDYPGYGARVKPWLQ